MVSACGNLPVLSATKVYAPGGNDERSSLMLNSSSLTVTFVPSPAALADWLLGEAPAGADEALVDVALFDDPQAASSSSATESSPRRAGAKCWVFRGDPIGSPCRRRRRCFRVSGTRAHFEARLSLIHISEPTRLL